MSQTIGQNCCLMMFLIFMQRLLGFVICRLFKGTWPHRRLYAAFVVRSHYTAGGRLESAFIPVFQVTG